MDTVVRNVCWLSPPEPPIFANTPKEAKERMLNIQQSSSAYNYYTEHCLGKGNGTIPASPAPNTSDSGSSAVIPVIVTFVVILLLATIVVAVWYIKKKKGRNVPLYDLQNHDSVNYLNNKAEVGEKWGGAQENVNYQHNKADKVQNWNGNQTNTTEWNSKNVHKSHNETHNVTKSKKNHEHMKNVKNNIELGEYTKNGQFEAYTSNPAATQRRQNKFDDEVIYANSQFEKVAKARNKKAAVEKVPSIRDAAPPVDVKTQDMYYIDENPYDRVDRREKPVPKKRNKVT